MYTYAIATVVWELRTCLTVMMINFKVKYFHGYVTFFVCFEYK